jgi:hypothetical protein
MGIGRTALFAVTVAALEAGCAHAPRPEVTRPISDHRCDDAARRVAARGRTRALDDLRRSGTTSLSLLATGAGWVTDGVLIGSATIAVGGLVCSPLFALEIAAKSNGEASARCFVEIGAQFLGSAPAPGVGRGVYRATRRWRCPDFVQLAREVTAVAGCYAARDAPGDRDVAFATLDQIAWDREIWECLPDRERAAIQEARGRLLPPALPPALPPPPPPSAAPPAPPDAPPAAAGGGRG